MSEVKHSPLCYPPQFPLQGRLPSRESQVHKNNERRPAGHAPVLQNPAHQPVF